MFVHETPPLFSIRRFTGLFRLQEDNPLYPPVELEDETGALLYRFLIEELAI